MGKGVLGGGAERPCRALLQGCRSGGYGRDRAQAIGRELWDGRKGGWERLEVWPCRMKLREADVRTTVQEERGWLTQFRFPVTLSHMAGEWGIETVSAEAIMWHSFAVT